MRLINLIALLLRMSSIPLKRRVILIPLIMLHWKYMLRPHLLKRALRHITLADSRRMITVNRVSKIMTVHLTKMKNVVREYRLPLVLRSRLIMLHNAIMLNWSVTLSSTSRKINVHKAHNVTHDLRPAYPPLMINTERMRR